MKVHAIDIMDYKAFLGSHSIPVEGKNPRPAPMGWIRP